MTTPAPTPESVAVRAWRSLHEDVTHAIERRRHPGGQQVGTEEWSGVPMSLMLRLRRTAQDVIEAAGEVARAERAEAGEREAVDVLRRLLDVGADTRRGANGWLCSGDPDACLAAPAVREFPALPHSPDCPWSVARRLVEESR